jgi:selenocysteine lyase/cysteine desulfurase
MNPPTTRSRRAFISSLGALSALGLAPSARLEADASQAPVDRRVPRGLAPGADDFLLAPGLVYLQTGSLGPTPRPVVERTVAAWKELELNPVFYGFGPQERAMEDVRAKAASFIGCKTAELLITRSTTEGMNWVAQGLDLKAGDRVLTTNQEHPGGRVCWDYVSRRLGVAIDVVAIAPGDHDAQAIVDRIAKAITPRTRVLSFSHLLTSTGLRMPVAEISALARRRGCLAVVDGAQAVGGISVDVKALGCHVYATSGHKWLLAPKGTGLLYLSEELGSRVDPIPLQAGRAVYSASSGVTHIPGVLGLAAAIDYVSAIGMATIEAHNLALRNRLYDALRGVRALRVVSAPAGPLASPLLTYELPESVKADALYQRLSDRHKVVVKVVPSEWLNGNRISTHLFNTAADTEALVAALKQELG